MSQEDHHMDGLRLDLVRWPDALQRHLDVPARALWFMACLAYEVDSTLPDDAITPAMQAWLFRVEELVTEVVETKSWDEAVRMLQIPERSPRSLAAWVERGAAPPLFRELLARNLDQSDASG